MNTLQRNQRAFEVQSKGFSSRGDTYADEAGLAWMLAELPMAADFSITQEKDREEILRALETELSGGAKTGLAPYTRDQRGALSPLLRAGLNRMPVIGRGKFAA